jgi:hypothetical protein
MIWKSLNFLTLLYNSSDLQSMINMSDEKNKPNKLLKLVHTVFGCTWIGTFFFHRQFRQVAELSITLIWGSRYLNLTPQKQHPLPSKADSLPSELAVILCPAHLFPHTQGSVRKGGR